MNKNKIIIFALSVGLFLLAQFVLYEKVSESISQDLTNSYENGYLQGITDAARLVYDQTENCQPTSVTVDNMTKNLFDLSCVNSQANNNQP